MNRPECIGRIEEAIEAGPTPGPWRWWTSNSYRRLSSDATGHDGDVLHGTIQRSDNHPDVQASQQTMDYIAAANPSALKELLAYVRELEKDAGRYRWLRDKAYFVGTEDDSDSPWIVAGTCYEDCRPVFDKEVDLLVDAAIASQSKDKQ